MTETCDDYKFPQRLVYYRQGNLIRDNSVYICPHCSKEYTKIDLYNNGVATGHSFNCFDCGKILIAP